MFQLGLSSAMLQSDILGADDGACITVSMQAQCFRNSQRSHANWSVPSIDLTLLGIIGVSQSEPHTSDVNRDFLYMYICIYVCAVRLSVYISVLNLWISKLFHIACVHPRL